MSTAIQSEKRETRRAVVNQLRNEGSVPSIVYGYKTEATPIAVKERDLLNTLRVTGRNGVIQLNMDGKNVNVVLNDYQSDALNGKILHADFLAINMTEELEVDVQVNLVGTSPGEKDGGVLQQPIREVKIRVKPTDIPEMIDVDISSLQIGETLLVADIREKLTFEVLNDDEDALVTISAPRSQEELDEDADETAAEPEVVNEQKGEE